MRVGLKILAVADVDPTDVIGGAERMLAGQLDELANRGHKITVLTRRQEGRPVEEVTRCGYRIVRYPMPAGMGVVDLLRALSTIRKASDDIIRRDAPDMLYIQQPLAGAGALLSSRGRRLPGAYLFLSPWSDEYRVRLPKAAGVPSSPESIQLHLAERIKMRSRKRIEQWTLQRVNRILIMSKFMLKRCQDLHDLPESKFAIVPGGVDTQHFHEYSDRDVIRKRLGIAAGERVLLSVRNLEPRMGLGNLIDAMPAILKDYPNTVCIIGGSGALLSDLKAQAQSLDLGDRVRFTGFIPEAELPEYYAAADLFVLPTTALEGFGMVTVESLACGTPVLGTPIGATPEILTGLDNDLLLAGVEPSDIARGSLSFLGRTQPQTEQLRAKCRAYAVDNYSWPMVVNGIESLVSDIVR